MYQSFADEHIQHWLKRVFEPNVKLTFVAKPKRTEASNLSPETATPVASRRLNTMIRVSGVTRRLVVVRILNHQNKEVCSFCLASFHTPSKLCVRGHRLGQTMGYRCSQCSALFDQASGRCKCGYLMDEIPIGQ